MREPLFTPGNEAARLHIVEGDPSSLEQARLSAAWHRATNLAIESAFTYGLDLPVGAVVLEGASILGRGFANDKRLNNELVHAEVMACLDTRFDLMGGLPNDTIVVNVEPCDNCQDYLQGATKIKKVAFGLSRHDMTERGLVKPHGQDIFERAGEYNFRYKVEQIEDEQLRRVNLAIFEHVRRNPKTEMVEVDTAALHDTLVAFNEE